MCPHKHTSTENKMMAKRSTKTMNIKYLEAYHYMGHSSQMLFEIFIGLKLNNKIRKSFSSKNPGYSLFDMFKSAKNHAHLVRITRATLHRL